MSSESEAAEPGCQWFPYDGCWVCNEAPWRDWCPTCRWANEACGLAMAHGQLLETPKGTLLRMAAALVHRTAAAESALATERREVASLKERIASGQAAYNSERVARDELARMLATEREAAASVKAAFDAREGAISDLEQRLATEQAKEHAEKVVGELLADLRVARKAREEAEAQVAFHKDREAHWARVLGVPDGGAYRFDWDARLRALVTERDALKSKVEALDDWRCVGPDSPERSCHDGLASLEEMCGACAAHALEAERDALKADVEQLRTELREANDEMLADGATLRADLKRKEEALEDLNGYVAGVSAWLPGPGLLAVKVKRLIDAVAPVQSIPLGAMSQLHLGQVTERIRAALSPSPEGRSEDPFQSRPMNEEEARMLKAVRARMFKHAREEVAAYLDQQHVENGGRPMYVAELAKEIRLGAHAPDTAKAPFPVTDPDLDAPDGTEVDGFVRVGKRWEPAPAKAESPARCGMPNYLGDRCIEPRGLAHGPYHRFAPTTPEPQEGK